MNYDKELELNLGSACPICGYGDRIFKKYLFSESYDNYDICISCGNEFGNDDWILDDIIFSTEHMSKLCELRKKWIEGGMKFWETDKDISWITDEVTLKLIKESKVERPQNWNPIQQLKNIPEEFLDEETKQFIKENEHNYGL